MAHVAKASDSSEPWALEALKNERDYLAQGPTSRTTVAAMDWAIREIERLRGIKDTDMTETHTTRRAPQMEKFVEIRPVIMEGYPDAHHVFLKVGNQQFCVSPDGCETKEEAEWTRDMLCIALAKVVEQSNQP